MIRIEWIPEDILGVRPTWSEEKCEEVLEEIGEHLKDLCIEFGYDTMEMLVKQYEREESDENDE